MEGGVCKGIGIFCGMRGFVLRVVIYYVLFDMMVDVKVVGLGLLVKGGVEGVGV